MNPKRVPPPNTTPIDDASISGTYRGSPDDLDLLPPGFEAISILGRGAMGVVVHARDKRLDREVAIKLLKLDASNAEGSLEALLHEARAAAKVPHPGLIEIYDCGVYGGSPYLVMERARGTTLRQWSASQRGGLSLDQVTSIMGQVASAIAALHAHGIAHRDIKPSNLIVDENMRVKLVDFGLAGVRGETAQHRGHTAGTPEYMAPEVVQKGVGTPAESQAADVYAMGVLTYELLTGQLPFDQHRDRALLDAHITQSPRPPSELREGLPPAFDALVFRALSKFAHARPTAEAFARRLALARGIVDANDPGEALEVLCVDDDPDVCAWVAEVIGEAFTGARVQCVLDGRDALETIDEHLPDIVIADIDMPRLDGIELAAVLRERPATRNIPVLIISGSGSGRDWQVLKEIGAAKMLLKPLDEADFLDDFRRVLQRHRRDLAGLLPGA